LRIFFGLLLWAAAGCGDDPPTGEDQGAACQGRGEAYQAGMSKPGVQGIVSVALTEAVPAPPNEGDNAWTVRVVDASGAPIEGAAVSVSTLMPDHGHGSPVQTVVTDEGGGDYRLDPVNLFMPGLWDVTIAVQPPGGEQDSVTFTFCVEG
jgi:hypothetical protein